MWPQPVQRRGEEPHARRETAEQHRQRAEAPEISGCFLDAVRGAERDAAVQRQDTGASQGASRIRNVIAQQGARRAGGNKPDALLHVSGQRRGDEQQEAARKRQAGPLD